MKHDAKEIFNMFGGKLVGNKILQKYVCETLVRMSHDIIDFVTEKCWFMGSMEDAWAYTFTGNDLKDQHLIFLSDELFQQKPEQIYYSIAHEVGHVILGHKNSTFYKQSRGEVARQEEEADEFAKRFGF